VCRRYGGGHGDIKMNTVLKISLAVSLALNAYLGFCLWSWVHPDAYSVTQLSNDSFLLEHKGKEHYTVRCREAVAWSNGFLNPAKPLGRCMYLRSYVGKTVRSGSIQIVDGTLLYIPLADLNGLQVADVFSIEDSQILK
jgi:hypothetical protein